MPTRIRVVLTTRRCRASFSELGVFIVKVSKFDLPELIYVKSDILSVKGKEFMHAFKLRSTGRSTRIYCEKCFSIIGVDHKSYRDNVFMFFKYHCSTNCDLSIEPSAAIYLNDLQDASQISKLQNIPLIFSFSEIETREFREIKRVPNSFN